MANLPHIVFELVEVELKERLGCDKRGLSAIFYVCLRLMKHGADIRILIEPIAQTLVNGFIHPIHILLLTPSGEVSVLLHMVDVFVYIIPQFSDAVPIETRVGEYLWHNSALGHRKQL